MAGADHIHTGGRRHPRGPTPLLFDAAVQRRSCFMSAKLALGLALVLGMFVVVGCEDVKKSTSQGAQNLNKQAGETLDKAKETADKAKESAEKAMKEGKEAVLKPIMDSIPKIEEKIKGLTGDKLKDATAKFDDFKKMLDNFESADASKWAGMKEELIKKFE